MQSSRLATLQGTELDLHPGKGCPFAASQLIGTRGRVAGSHCHPAPHESPRRLVLSQEPGGG
jgi:hypothetical protein